MDGLLSLLVVLAGLAVILSGFAWFASRVRRRGLGGSVMGPFDEVWHPAAYQAHIEVRAQAERAVSTESPSDQ